MGKKRRKREANKQRRIRDAVPPVKDRRALEKTMANLGRLLEEREFDSLEEANAFLQQALMDGEVGVLGHSAVDRAQDLMYEAWDAAGSQQIELALEALKLSPN